jgi:hypothetical protein
MCYASAAHADELTAMTDAAARGVPPWWPGFVKNPDPDPR